MTVRRRGGNVCPSPYPPVAALPPFELRDLAGKRVNCRQPQGQAHAHQFLLRACVPCILEVGPINRFAAGRPGMNFLAVTFDEAESRARIRRALQLSLARRARCARIHRPHAREAVPDDGAVRRNRPAARHAGRRRPRRARGRDRGAAARALGGWVVASQQDRVVPEACQPAGEACVDARQAHDSYTQGHRRGDRRQPFRPRCPSRRARGRGTDAAGWLLGSSRVHRPC